MPFQPSRILTLVAAVAAAGLQHVALPPARDAHSDGRQHRQDGGADDASGADEQHGDIRRMVGQDLADMGLDAADLRAAAMRHDAATG